ncbi:MAG TPA: hypothetical protein VFH88_09995 [Candidatus Krumholzibacteria bacterium]|nr:hypothetical protein [Candidatus Krumholzibacteria bacterium]
MKRNVPLITLACAVVALAAWQLAPTRASQHAANESPTPARVATTPVATPASNAGYTVHLDPSGQIVDQVTPEQQAEFNTELNQMINTSQEGLVEQAVPAGGYKVDLQGRFENASAATVDASGKVTVPCLTNENDVRAFEKTTAANDAAKKE